MYGGYLKFCSIPEETVKVLRLYVLYASIVGQIKSTSKKTVEVLLDVRNIRRKF